MVPVGWHDTVRLTPADTFRFTCSDPSLPHDEGNLCVRAVRLMEGHHGKEAPFALHLDKRIPYGAGLGGGSSDAAQTLNLFQELPDWRVPAPVLHDMAARLGADVPFFLESQPARATGRGEVLEALDGVLPLPFAVLVICPPVHVDTATAYRHVIPSSEGRPDLAELVQEKAPERWRQHLCNDFEASVFRAHPGIQALKMRLQESGAVYAAMSGSGSSVFGLYEDPEALKGAVAMFDRRLYRVWAEAA